MKKDNFAEIIYEDKSLQRKKKEGISTYGISRKGNSLDKTK